MFRSVRGPHGLSLKEGFGGGEIYLFTCIFLLQLINSAFVHPVHKDARGCKVGMAERLSMIEWTEFDDSADLRRLELAKSKKWMKGGEPEYGM